MHAGLPDFVVVAQAVAAEREFSGTLPVTALRRLLDCLLNDGGTIDACCRFRRDEQGRAAFRLSLDGSLCLECQRCRQGFRWPLSRTVDFRIVASEAEAGRIEDEAVEPCVAHDGRVDLLATIEDEAILSLPVVARHADESACAYRAPAPPEPDEQEQRESPFAVLKRLRGRSDD